MDDAARFEAAGIYDPRAENASERLELLRWLATKGATVEQMADAWRKGLLLGLAGDMALRPPPHLTLREVADRVGLTPEEIVEFSLAAGLRQPTAPDEASFTESDVETFKAFVGGAALLGIGAMKRFLRTMGAGLGQIAEGAVALYLVAREGPMLRANMSELTIAQQGLVAIESLDLLHAGMSGLFRAHMETAIRRQRAARREWSVDTLHLTVGFVDLVSFTTLTRRMAHAELDQLIDRFEESAARAVASRDGRLVKLVGDEVMFVCVDAAAACDIALSLLERFAGDPTVTPRGALATGELLYRGGDYYGPVVNLAARLADLAVPGELLVTPEVAAEAPTAPLRFERAGKRMLKGFDEPVTVLAVTRA